MLCINIFVHLLVGWSADCKLLMYAIVQLLLILFLYSVSHI